MARGPSSMLQAVQGFQLGCGGDQETTPAGWGWAAAVNSARRVSVTRETASSEGVAWGRHWSERRLQTPETGYCSCERKKIQLSQYLGSKNIY